MRTFFCLLAAGTVWLGASAFREPALKRVYFNLYTDSLKPVLNYYVNVEGEYRDGSYRPLDTASIRLTADWGELRGNEWVIPPRLLHDSVTFYVRAKENPALGDTITIWIKKWKDPRDAPDYSDPLDEAPPQRSRRR